jgi:hypothetical protein
MLAAKPEQGSSPTRSEVEPAWLWVVAPASAWLIREASDLSLRRRGRWAASLADDGALPGWSHVAAREDGRSRLDGSSVDGGSP